MFGFAFWSGFVAISIDQFFHAQSKSRQNPTKIQSRTHVLTSFPTKSQPPPVFQTNKSSFTVVGDDQDGSAFSPATTEQEEQIVTSYTVFLSPSPVNYTFDNIENKNTEMTRLEISFAASFVSDKTFIIKVFKLRFLIFYFTDEKIRNNHYPKRPSRFTQANKYSNNW